MATSAKNITSITVCIILMIALSACRYRNVPVPERYGTINFFLLNDEQKRDFLRTEKHYPEDIIEEIVKGRLRSGMTKEQAVYSWGWPDDVYATGGMEGTHERWTYNRIDSKTQYLYFDNAKLTSWRDWE